MMRYLFKIIGRDLGLLGFHWNGDILQDSWNLSIFKISCNVIVAYKIHSDVVNCHLLIIIDIKSNMLRVQVQKSLLQKIVKRQSKAAYYDLFKPYKKVEVLVLCIGQRFFFFFFNCIIHQALHKSSYMVLCMEPTLRRE